MTYQEQLALWAEGTPVHGEQCCPDFSCCEPQFLAPKPVRDIFVAAYKVGNETVTMRMLMEFLGKAFAGNSVLNVHIVGLEQSRQEVRDAK